MTSVPRRIAMAFAAWTVVTAASHGSIWVEVGDAGDQFNPQTTVGIGPLITIEGVIGEPIIDDFVDAFLFYFGGAPSLSITAEFDAPLPPDSELILALELFDESGNVSFDQGVGSLLTFGLLPGFYTIGVFLDDDGPDPPYTLTFGPADSPDGAQFAATPGAVPEPTALAVWTVLAVAASAVGIRVNRGNCS